MLIETLPKGFVYSLSGAGPDPLIFHIRRISAESRKTVDTFFPQ
jgi:hypothetical protein